MILLLAAGHATGQPPLPEGLNDTDEPTLPAGLGEPLDEETEDDAPDEREPRLPFELNGFWETRIGLRLQDDPHQDEWTVGETRLQLEAGKTFENNLQLNTTADLLYDPVAHDHGFDLDRGEGPVLLREANAAFSPLPWLDVKLGRQVLTWGTGDLVFVNDLFPKDWRSFLIGRDPEYLKAPSDALKVSLFTEAVNFDLVYTPRFEPDRFVSGDRLSYYNPQLGRRAGEDDPIRPVRRDDWIRDDEWAMRAYRRLGSWELAGYGYYGFWKSPLGFDPARGAATFPRLAVYGASIRGPMLGGISNAEIGYYDSLNDQGGGDPFTPNSQVRLLIGHEREVARNLMLGMQYYLEHMLDHEAYQANLPAGMPEADHNRHLLTARLTWLTHRQTVEWSLFAFYSPSDEDVYLRPRVLYDLDDNWRLEAGGNAFLGRHDHTFFGQFENNTNAYVAVRYSF
ncbi:MAG: hypothetical protein ACOC9P_00600 [bacterium]